MSRTIRIIVGVALLAFVFWSWTVDDDLIELIIRQKEVLFGKFSRPGFGVRVLITLLFGGTALLLLSRIKTFGEMLGTAIMVTLSTSVAIAALVYGSAFLAKGPRYVEQEVAPQTAEGEVQLQGIVRHRPPNENYVVSYTDEPLMARSYPDAPPGYGTVDITLTTDKYGFRNREVLDTYDIVVVGDSFAAGSHVSDEQAWPEILSDKLQTPIYNMGVSGTEPQTYLNNFATAGTQFSPRTVIFMIYEGNDFKHVYQRAAESAPAQAATKEEAAPAEAKGKSLGELMEEMAKMSPVTAGLRELSANHLEKIGADRPLPEYHEKMGWMPLEVASGANSSWYSFKPKRLMYLYKTREEFLNSEEWQSTTWVLKDIQRFTEAKGINLILVYAPAKPHVTMALAESADIPADQLRHFASYIDKGLPEAEVFKATVLERLGNQEAVFMEFCDEQEISCLSLVPALQKATAAGVQTFYTYDQHWTPEGNQVVAEEIARFLSEGD